MTDTKALATSSYWVSAVSFFLATRKHIWKSSLKWKQTKKLKWMTNCHANGTNQMIMSRSMKSFYFWKKSCPNSSPFDFIIECNQNVTTEKCKNASLSAGRQVLVFAILEFAGVVVAVVYITSENFSIKLVEKVAKRYLSST